MPYSLLPAQLDYPPISTSTWVVISRLSELPIRTVPDLSMVNHASEFALPFPTGQFPVKVSKVTFDAQEYNEFGVPLYDDGSPDGTALDVDGGGNPLPPRLVSVTEERTVSLQDSPSLFTAEEIYEAVKRDFLKAYPFYDWVRLVLFDDRTDGTSIYQGKHRQSGLASGSHPLFLGPFAAPYDLKQNPRGHLVLIAPVSPDWDYFFQIRYGIAGTSGFKGPIEDLAQASRQGNVALMRAMENLPITSTMLADSNNIETSHFWIRSKPSGLIKVPGPEDQYAVIPWIVLMGRSTGAPTPT